MRTRNLFFRTLAVLCAGILALAFVPAPRAQAATYTLAATNTKVPIGSNATALYKCSDPRDCTIGARLKDVPSHWVYASVDAQGWATLTMNYQNNIVQSWAWEVWAFSGGRSIPLETLFVYFTPRLTLLSSPLTAAPGAVVTARVGVAGVRVRSFAAIDYWDGTMFRTHSNMLTTSATEFALPLRAASSGVGLYTFRASVNYNGITGYSREFKLARGEVKLWSAPSRLHVGQTGTATGKLIIPAFSNRTGNLQVWHGGRWVTIRSARANSAGLFTVPLAYGVATRGSYRFRLNYTLGNIQFNSPAWTVTRA